MFSRNVFSVTLYSFYSSSTLSSLALSKKHPHWVYFNTGSDVEKACKKTITMIKVAGYKAEYSKHGTILM